MPKELDEKQIEGLQRILSLLDPETLTKETFTKAFKNVVEEVNKLKALMLKEIGATKTALEAFNEKLKADTGNDVAGLKTEINRLVNAKLSNIDIRHNGKLRQLDDRMASIRDGKDADEDRVIKKTLKELVKEIPSVKKIMKGVKKEKVRDALESLEGDERLQLGTIRGLRSILRRLEERPLGKSGGGFSYIAMDRHIIDPYLPTGTQNGTNKDFGLTRTPNPPESLQVFRGGALQSLTEDYTLSGTTVSFLVAPAAGEILKVTHRI